MNDTNIKLFAVCLDKMGYRRLFVIWVMRTFWIV